MQRLILPVWLLLLALPAVAQQARTYSLGLQFPPGRTEKMTVTQELRQTLRGDALPKTLDQVQKQEVETTLRVTGDAALELTFDKIRSSDNFRGRTVSYDSDKDRDSQDPSAKVLNGLIGGKASLRFADGKLTEFRGMNDVLDGLASKYPEQKAMVIQLRQQLGDEAYQQLLTSGLTGFLPNRAVALNDFWFGDQNQTLAGLGKLLLKLEYRLEGVEDRDGRPHAKITFTGKGVFEGVVGFQGLKLDVEEVKQRGVIFFDLQRGWLTELISDQTLKGTVTTTTNGKEVRVALEQAGQFTVKIMAAR